METDLDLVLRCREHGDAEAFTELVRRHREPVFRLAASILGQGFTPEAEDVTQDVFLRVHHALTTFHGDAQFSSWVYRITFNLAVNLKARVRYRAPHLNEDALVGKSSPSACPLQQVEDARRNRALMDAIHELPEVYQAALRLHYWLGEGIAQIAVLIGVPENTVKSYLHRARKLLHAMLEERGFPDV